MDHLYRKIKDLRNSNNITLKKLSEQTGLSISFLSQIEQGSTSLAITSLKKIADAFGVSISHFFSDIDNYNYSVKINDQKPFTVEGSNIIHTRLSGKFENRKLETMTVILPPNKDFYEKFNHPGEEFYYVLKGEVIFSINGNEYHLFEGESIHFPSNLTHQWKNPSSYNTKMLSILTPALF